MLTQKAMDIRQTPNHIDTSMDKVTLKAVNNEKNLKNLSKLAKQS